MSTARQLWNHPLRLTTTLVVLAGVVKAVVACSSGEIVGRDAARSDEGEDSVAVAKQALNWPGGCACLPIKACPSITTTGGCVKASTDCVALDARCTLGSSYCYVAKDETACSGTIGGKNICDGGYCGECPGCYLKSGLCSSNGGTTIESCRSPEGLCENCDDGNDCTKDECSTRGCTHSFVEDKTACSGGIGACFGGKCCTGCMQNGSCQAGNDVVACGLKGVECNACQKPSNPCLQAVCSDGGCTTKPVASGTSCSDNNICNGEEACDGNGTCQPGVAKDCTSSDPCVEGSCDTKNGCVLKPKSGAKCSDGDACTVGDLCDASGKCVGGVKRTCNDGKTCTDDTCDPATGNCKNAAVANNTPCDDGAACTTGETCQNGACTAGAVACDDGNFCTKDTVVCPAGTCSPDPSPMNGQACIPTDKCFYSGTCGAGTCVGNTAVNCDDGNPCTKDSCDPAVGCKHENEPATTACVDGNPCTTDDRCRPLTGKCAGTPIVCAPLDDCHSSGTCDSVTGRCDDPRRIDGFPCANATGSCAAGVCKVSATGGVAGAPGSAGAAGDAGMAATDSGGASGAPSGLGGDTAAGGTTGGQGSGQGGTEVDEHDVYKRNPGGCSCRLQNSTAPHGLALFGLLALAIGARRKRER